MGVLQELIKKAAGAADASGVTLPKGPLDPAKPVVLRGDGASLQYPPPVMRQQMMLDGVDVKEAPDGSEIARLSYADLADPWYPKGFARELEASQARQAELADRADSEILDIVDEHGGYIQPGREGDFWRSGAYVTPSMNPLSAFAPLPVRIKDYDILQGDVLGSFDTAAPGAGVNVSRDMLLDDITGLGADQTVAHELNHAASIWDQRAYGRMLPWTLVGAKKALKHSLLDLLMGRTKGMAMYLADMEEVDPRLAAMRRMYTYNTGRSVNNVDDAEAAWRWWSRRGQPLAWGPETPVRETDFDFYNSLSPDVMKYLMHRMTVTPALLAPLLAQPEEEPLAP